MDWEQLRDEGSFALRRSGRYLVADLRTPHRVLSTSVRQGGQVDHLEHLVNHQSCEGAGHMERHDLMTEAGLEAYHDRVCGEIGLPADRTAVMGTAASMTYAAVVTDARDDVSVTAVVTAGVEGNATTAGEAASWTEGREGVQARRPASRYDGTINTLLLSSRGLTPGALARAVVTMTEGKSVALARLAVPSTKHRDLASGTGTDQYCLAAPADDDRPLTSASPHVTLGELIGRVTCEATLEALRWQNGLEPSYTRSIFHALGRYGLRRASLVADLTPLLDDGARRLLERNLQAVGFDPLVGSAAHALASVEDRVRHGTLPPSVAVDARAQQAALLAANVAAQPERWGAFRTELQPHARGELKDLALRALALGWSSKWTG